MARSLLPAGGLHELRAKHKLGWEYFDALVHLAQAGAILSRQEVTFGMRFVVASLWTVAANARPMAVEKLKLSGNDYIACIIVMIGYNICAMLCRMEWSCLPTSGLKLYTAIGQ